MRYLLLLVVLLLPSVGLHSDCSSFLQLIECSWLGITFQSKHEVEVRFQ